MTNYEWSEEDYQQTIDELYYGVPWGRIPRGGRRKTTPQQQEKPEPKDTRYYRDFFRNVMGDIEGGRRTASDEEYYRIVNKWQYYKFRSFAPELYKSIRKQGLTYSEWWKSLDFPERIKLERELLI